MHDEAFRFSQVLFPISEVWKSSPGEGGGCHQLIHYHLIPCNDWLTQN